MHRFGSYCLLRVFRITVRARLLVSKTMAATDSADNPRLDLPTTTREEHYWRCCDRRQGEHQTRKIPDTHNPSVACSCLRFGEGSLCEVPLSKKHIRLRPALQVMKISLHDKGFRWGGIISDRG